MSASPRTGAVIAGPPESTPNQVRDAVVTAAAAAVVVADTDPTVRQTWLHAVAEAVEQAADELVAIADDETALGEPRLRGELAKAAANARYYAAVGVRGEWLQARVETVAGPPAVDLRRAQLSLGPVAVFGASNFPFQFGVVGHDTCSALAAGCPVVVKAHPAHPRLSARLAEIVGAALAAAGAPSGSFALVVGFEAGLALVDAPEITAVGFTGSQRGGLALVDRAGRRPRPIPVYAEMGTVNPVVVTAAGAARTDEVAEGFARSFTLGLGQFCTKPGLLLVPRGSGVPEAVAARVTDRDGGWLLTGTIAQTYAVGVQRLAEAGAVTTASGQTPDAGFAAAPHLLRAEVDDLRPGSPLLEECFGPVALVVEYDGLDQALAVLGRLQPSLAASVWAGRRGSGSSDGDPEVAPLVRQLAGQVGRVIVDGWPTGVACADAMQRRRRRPAALDPPGRLPGRARRRPALRPAGRQPLAPHPLTDWLWTTIPCSTGSV
jgi:NADP-dependent aldehyde dehydrogenase